METCPGIVRGCVTVCTRARRVVKSTRDDSRSTLSPSLPVSRYCYVRAVHANVSPAKSNVLQAHACSYAPGEQRPPLVTRIYLFRGGRDFRHCAPSAFSIIHYPPSRINYIGQQRSLPSFRTNRAVGIIRGRKQGGGLPPLDESINNRNQVKFKLAAVPYAESPV